MKFKMSNGAAIFNASPGIKLVSSGGATTAPVANIPVDSAPVPMKKFRTRMLRRIIQLGARSFIF